MAKGTLCNKITDEHAIRVLPDGDIMMFIDQHLLHEVTSSPAFIWLDERLLKVRYPHRQLAYVDHVAPTDWERKGGTEEDRALAQALKDNCAKHGILCNDAYSKSAAIVHVGGPETGLTQPGMTIVCGDSHTSTHGAFGNLSCGIGTSQVFQVLATQCLPIAPSKVRRIVVTGKLQEFVTAKDVILYVIHQLGVGDGKGFAYEYSGDTIEAMTMAGRMTVCNMTIEGGARFGYVNPDQTTVDYLRGRKYAPKEADFDAAAAKWLSYRSDSDAKYDDTVEYKAENIPCTITWGTNPGESIPLNGKIPANASAGSLKYMGFSVGDEILGKKIDVAFIGSCTNSRIEDLRAAAQVVKGKTKAAHVIASVVPGSEDIRRQAEAEGLDEIFKAAGFDWRRAGCSRCLAMNDDKLVGNQLCISTSNRNFKGRMGSPTGRTMLASPLVVAASAILGAVADPQYMGA